MRLMERAEKRALGMFVFEYPLLFRENLVEAAKQAVAKTAPGKAVRFTRHPFKKVTLLSPSPLVLEIEDFLPGNMLQKVLDATKKGTWERSITIDE